MGSHSRRQPYQGRLVFTLDNLHGIKCGSSQVRGGEAQQYPSQQKFALAYRPHKTPVTQQLRLAQAGKKAIALIVRQVIRVVQQDDGGRHRRC
jgi:hypothetical protein